VWESLTPPPLIARKLLILGSPSTSKKRRISQARYVCATRVLVDSSTSSLPGVSALYNCVEEFAPCPTGEVFSLTPTKTFCRLRGCSLAAFTCTVYYHAGQAIEKYLKALALAVIDPDGKRLTALNARWVRTHDLNKLAKRCANQFPYYGTADTTRKLALFTEFDQATRYPWVSRALGNGFSSADVPAMWDLIRHLRTDIPIKTDDYLLGMVVRGHHQGRPDTVSQGTNCRYALPKAAVERMFPDVTSIVRW